MKDDIYQNLRKIGPTYSTVGEKQAQLVELIKRGEIRTELQTHFNMNIQGLRKRKTPFGRRPANIRLWDPLSAYSRNGILHLGLSRNWVRFVFPMIPMFFMVYMMEPVVWGIIDLKYNNNYQWEGIYHKFGSTRMVYSDQSITRLA